LLKASHGRSLTAEQVAAGSMKPQDCGIHRYWRRN